MIVKEMTDWTFADKKLTGKVLNTTDGNRVQVKTGEIERVKPLENGNAVATTKRGKKFELVGWADRHAEAQEICFFKVRESLSH